MISKMDSQKQLGRGDRVERIAAADNPGYCVPGGAQGEIVYVYDTEPGASAFDVRWDGRELPAFCAGSRLRPIRKPIK